MRRTVNFRVALSGLAALVLGLLATPSVAQSESKARDSVSFAGPASVDHLLRDDLESKSSFLEKNFFAPLDAWKKNVHDRTGLKIGGDYNVLYLSATAGPGDRQSGGGVARLYGSWELTGRGTPDTGSLVYKIEHRHKYTDVAPTGLGPSLGYAGLVNQSFSDQGFRATNLYWRQSMLESKVVSYLGFLDVTDYVDVYLLASPWTAFGNLVFGTGSGTIGGLPDGALGAMAAGWLSENVYASGGIADANADVTDIFKGFNTFFDKFETFKSAGLAWTPDRKRLTLDNLQLTFWQIDKRKDAGTPNGRGVSFSASKSLDDRWLTFLRGGWADDGGSTLEASVSAGFGYQLKPGGDLFAVGLNWGRPNRDTYGRKLDDQYTTEVFYRWQAAPHLQVTPSIQLLVHPASNPDERTIAVVGLRARVAF